MLKIPKNFEKGEAAPLLRLLYEVNFQNTYTCVALRN